MKHGKKSNCTAQQELLKGAGPDKPKSMGSKKGGKSKGSSKSY